MRRARWVLPLLILLVWLGSAGPLSALGAKLTGLQENDIAAFLPDSAESTRVQELQGEFQPVEQCGHRGGAQVDGIAQAAGGERLPASSRVHDRHESADVGPVEPVDLGEPLPDSVQLDGQPAQEQCQLPAIRHVGLPPVILSTIKIIERQGKSCLACPPSPAGCCRL